MLTEDEVKETVLNGPALCITNHPANGETVLRSGKVVKKQNDYHALWNYSKLCYNTKYPWESQQYVLNDVKGGYRSLCNITYWGGMTDGILYRKQFYDYRTDVEAHFMQGVFLADFPVAHGIMRVDKLKLFRRPVILTLGSYGFKDNGTEIQEYEKEGARAIVLKGYDAAGKKKQMAMTVFGGFMETGCVASEGSNPDSERSLVIYAFADLHKQYGGCEPYVFISQTITKESYKDFTEDEIFPVKKIQYTDEAGCGTYGEIAVILKNSSIKRVAYHAMEGGLSL